MSARFLHVVFVFVLPLQFTRRRRNHARSTSPLPWFLFRALLLKLADLTPPAGVFAANLFCRWTQELDCSPRKVETIVAQAKRLKEVAARSGLPDEVSHEKVAAVQAEAMKVHGRRRHRQLPDLAEAGD